MAAYYLDKGYTLESIKGEGYCGTLVNGVITFPVEALLCMFGTDGPYYANTNGEFKIVLPTATSSATTVAPTSIAPRSASAFSHEFNFTNKKVVKLHDYRMFTNLELAR
jgi:hypothetical protein